jgi:hypothetical protein
MAFKPKLWLGVGAFALAGSVHPAAAEPAVNPDPSASSAPARTASPGQPTVRPVILAQARAFGGEGGALGLTLACHGP